VAAAKLLVALASFSCELHGRELLVHAGDVLENNHPAVKGREDLFEAAAPRPNIERDAVSPKHSKRRRER
jgi:hypothetical protein